MSRLAFQPLSAFQQHISPSEPDYRLLPFRFARLEGSSDEVLMVSECGEYLFLSEPDFRDFVGHRLPLHGPLARDLRARHLLCGSDEHPPLELMAAKYRTQKSFLRGGPALHIFVVTLRCDHSCRYCQVSRRAENAYRYDMSEETAREAVDRLFECPARHITVEFQGGEPLLAFERIRFIIEAIQDRNAAEGRDIRFVVASTLHFLDERMLGFFRGHQVFLSTSLDGPEWLHNMNRPNRERNSYRKTVEGIRFAREHLGPEAVAALTTLSRASLSYPREIVDAYVENGFRSIFLRPISPYGYAARSDDRLGYRVEEFLRFYESALGYILRLNRENVPIDEAYAALLLSRILSSYPTGYVNLRSPAGEAFGAIVYNYNGKVYASDEARMLAEMGDETFCLGSVSASYRDLMQSDAARLILSAGIAESLPGCSECAFLPYCGADTMDAYARQGDPVGHRPTSDFCAKHMGMFRLLFRYLRKEDPEIMKVFLSWLNHRAPDEIVHPGYLGG